MLPNEQSHKIAGLDAVLVNMPSSQGVFKNMVDSALSRIKAGDQRFAPVDQIVFGKLNALADEEKLDKENWEVVRTDDSVIIINKDFLAIQDEFGHLEGAAGIWDGAKCKNALGRYISIYSSQRRAHLDLFRQALDSLSQNGQSQLSQHIKELWAKETGSATFDEASNNFQMQNRLVAIPWVDDSPFVWDQILKLPKELTDRYSTVKKINEIGLIFASRNFRGQAAPSHDYFSYAHAVAKQRNTDMKSAFLSTASHEGSHGPIENVASLIAGIPELSFISEGFPSVFGNDSREYDQLSPNRNTVNIDLLIDYEQEPDDSVRKSLIYVGGARFYRSLINILEKRESPKPWLDIVKNLFLTADDMQKIDEKDPSLRLRFFTESLLKRLDLSKEELNEEMKTFEKNPKE